MADTTRTDGMPADAGRVLMDLAPGESVWLGADIKVLVIAKSGRVARLCITAPRSVRVKKESGTKHEMMAVPGG